MKLLLDTCTFLWLIDGARDLPPRVVNRFRHPENEVYLSAASAWEIATKVRIGKLVDFDAVALDVPAAIASQGFEELPVSVVHAQRAGSLPGSHRDPFDRMLAAQAQIEGIAIVSADVVFDAFRVPRIA